MPDLSKLAAKAQASLGLPEGFELWSPFPFGGMNVEGTAIAIADQEFTYMENFIRAGDGYLRTAWDAGDAIYRAPGNLTIVHFFFYTIGTDYFEINFLSDGSAVQVALDTLIMTPVGPPGTFWDPNLKHKPDCSQWGTQYLLISNNNSADDYWIWDGALLYQAGTVAPGGVEIVASGSNYTGAPLPVAFGGTGTGFTADAIVNGGSVVAVNITNPGSGYSVGDIVQIAFLAGGSGNTPQWTATLAPVNVEAVVVSAEGFGYTFANVTLVGGGGTGATAVATVAGGRVISIAVTNGGANYTNNPGVVITGDGFGAAASSYLAATSFTGAGAVHNGTGFSTVPDVAIVGGNGVGALAYVTLQATSIARIDMITTGGGYLVAPTVTFVGGNGTGATATVTLDGGAVASINLTNGGSGYTQSVLVQITPAAGDPGTGASAIAIFTPTTLGGIGVSAGGLFYTQTPAIVIAPGSNTTAYANVKMMPFGVSGSCIETFQSRVFLGDPAVSDFTQTPSGGLFQVSAPGSYTDFATSDGGVLFTNSDAFLQTRYVDIKQSNGYLYFFGDGSVSVVSNVQTSGSPSTTTFNYQNVDPQAGLSWRQATQDFGRSIIVANENGIYGLYGGSVTKISQKMRQLFVDAVFPSEQSFALEPSSATATIFNVKHYLLLMTITDPDSGQPRDVMVTWNEKEWNITSQTVDLIEIGQQKVESQFFAWGTDGKKIYPLFNKPSSNLVKRLDTKAYGANSFMLMKELWGVWAMAQDQSVDLSGVQITVNFNFSGISDQGQDAQNPSVASQKAFDTMLNQPDFQAPPPFWPLFGTAAGGTGLAVQALLTTTSPDFVLGQFAIGYTNRAAVF